MITGDKWFWLRNLGSAAVRPTRMGGARRRGPKHSRRALLSLEALEDRAMMATITWTNAAGGDWNTAANWDLNRLPDGSDDVVIPDLGPAGSNLTITYGAGDSYVQSITTAELLSITGGTLTDYGNLSGAGSLEVAGGAAAFRGTHWENSAAISLTSGTLDLGGSFTQAGVGAFQRTGGTVFVSGTLTGGLALGPATGDWYLAGGTIDGGTITTDADNTLKASIAGATFSNGVTISTGSTFDMAEQSAQLHVTDGLTIDGKMLLGDDAGNLWSALLFSTAQEIGGRGELSLGSGTNYIYTTGQGPATFTFGPELTIRAKGGVIAGMGSESTYIMQGPIIVAPGGVGLTITESVGDLQTPNQLTVEDGAALLVTAQQWHHSGTVTVGDGGVLTADSLTNTGTIDAANATVNFGGNFTQAGVGAFHRTGGTVNVTGTLTGGLTLGPATGDWYLTGGTIDGGTITTDADNTLKTTSFFGPGNYLNAATISAGSTLDIAETSSQVTVSGGLTIDGRLLLGDELGATGSSLLLSTSQQIGGSGELVLGGGTNYIYTTAPGQVTSTFLPELTVRARSGWIIGDGSATYIMQGPIIVEPGGVGLAITNGVGDLQTPNQLTVEDGAALLVTAQQWHHSGTVTVGDGGVLTADSLTNTGTIVAANATVNFGGSFTQAGVGAFHRTGGTVNVTGTLSGGLTLGPTTGDWYLAGGTIDGGTITTDADNTLKTTSFFGPGNYLNAATISAGSTLDIAETSSQVTVSGGLTIDGRLLLGDEVGATGSSLLLSTSQQIGGSGELVLGGGTNYIYTTAPGPVTSTFLPELTVRARSGWIIGDGSAASEYIMQGPIIVEPGGVGLAISRLIVNLETTSIHVSDGATLAIDALNWTNHGSLDLHSATVSVTGLVTNLAGGVLTGGQWRVIGDSTLRLPEGITTLAADLELDGVDAWIYQGPTGTIDALAGLSVITSGNSLAIKNGRTLVPTGDFTNAATLLIGPGSTLGDPVVPNAGGRFLQTGGSTTVDGRIAFDQGITIDGGTFAGRGTVQGNLVNHAGNVQPGGPLGILTVNGNYTQSAAGTVDIEIGGTNAGSQYDRLAVSGTATLNGTLHVALADGFGTSLNQTFTAMTFAGRSGDFSSTNLPSVGGNPILLPTFASNSLVLNSTFQAPDLALESLVGPQIVRYGQPASVSYTVRNLIDTPAVGGWTDSVYLSLDQVLDAGDTLWAQKSHAASLAGLAAYTDTITASPPAISGGNYYVIVSANTPQNLLEVSRNNNLGTSFSPVAVLLDENTMRLDEQTIGTIESPFSVDRWFFSAAASQSVTLANVHADIPSAVRFKLTGPNGFVGFTDLTSNSDVVVLPQAGTYALEVASHAGGTGNYSFRVNQTSTIPLQLGVAYQGVLPSSGFAQAFQLSIDQATPLRIRFDGAIGTDRINIYSKLGRLPSSRVNDYRNSTEGSDHIIEVPLAAPGDLFIVIYGEYVPNPSEYTIEVVSQSVSLTRITPASYEAGTANAAIAITGLGFLPGTQVELVPANGPTIPAQNVVVNATTRLTATLDLTTVPAGSYGVRVTLPGGVSESLPGSFQVADAGAGKLETQLILPSFLGRRAAGTLILQYANTGTAAIAAPLLSVHSTDPDDSDRPLLTLDSNMISVGLWTTTPDSLPGGIAHEASIYATGVSPGLLLPGEVVRVPMYYAGLQQPWDFSDNAIELGIGVIDTTDTRLIDYDADFTRPDWIDSLNWPTILENLQAQIGTTWGEYVQTLGRNAAYLGRFGQTVTDIAELYRFEVAKANGISPVGAIASAVDAYIPAPGLPVVFSRSFGNTITSRSTVAAFGAGWEAPAQAFLEVFTDGTLLVHESNDGLRRFQPDIRREGTYFSQTGDSGVMISIGGEFELTESSGFKSVYRADGKLNSIQDINGNRLTYGYTGDLLTSIASISGGSLTISYNAAGRIREMVDSAGHTTTYIYDATNRYLLSVTGPDGTTSYTYETNAAVASRNALLSETGPDGMATHYEYDARGRLTAAYLSGNVERIDFTYDSLGQITSTDRAGVSSHTFVDHQGRTVRSEDALGHYVVYAYNDRGQLIQATDDLGRTTSYTREATGGAKTITDVYGHTTVTFTPGGPNNRPMAFTDANGNVTRYAYDAAGNPIATTYTDGTVERATYDALGNLDTTTNRRGQIVDRTVNAAGQVTREVWSDGTIRDYTYDVRGRLQSATDSLAGTTTLAYDNADRLTRIDYPHGRWITYAYDAAGRRTQIADSSGFATRYEYDMAGRLVRLRDATNALIDEYTYDVAGRLTREDKGNGTYTLYEYDAAGRQSSILNYAPDNSLNSEFLYTYDAAGRRDSQTTSDGHWTYTYDLVNQLTRAVFVSTNPSIANQDLRYEYDPLGNRIRTVQNGVTTDYAANSMNQYTTAGSTTFLYDDDGNLVQENGPDGLKQYTYDQLNRLIRVETPAGVWRYEYDVLGNRSAVVFNGVRTEYLVDPSGLGNVIGEYNGTGTRTSSYSHGLGLEAMAGQTGTAYYDFDAIGSTSGLSNTAGAYVASYAYNPWGESLLKSEAIPNAFEFVGQFGVMEDGNGLYFMRARYYSSTVGRFIIQDPIRYAGGQANLYGYVAQNPVNAIDPTGLLTCSGDRLIRRNEKAVEEDLAEREVLARRTSRDIWAGNVVELIQKGEDLDPDILDYVALLNVQLAIALENLERIEREIAAILAEKCPKPDPDPKPQPAPKPKTPTCGPPPSHAAINASDAGGGGGDASGGSCEGGDLIPVPMAIDPNEKFGALGYGPQAFITGEQPIPYRIHFENLGPGTVPAPANPATAPAQRVDVKDQLSPQLDWSSFEFTDFGWGDTVEAVPAGLAHYFTKVEMTYNGNRFEVEVELNFDRTTGLMTAVFQSVDPETFLPPEVLTGFLPPEDGTGIGKAHVSYTVRPIANLPSGTEIRNVGTIRFDFQQTIATNQIDPENATAGTDPNKEALNTIDAGVPASSVAALPRVTSGTAGRHLLVSWSGVDEPGGSGIADYDVYAAVDNGAWQLWLEGTTETSAIFAAAAGHTYRFYSVARDNVGHLEPAPDNADARTSVIGLLRGWRMPVDSPLRPWPAGSAASVGSSTAAARNGNIESRPMVSDVGDQRLQKDRIAAASALGKTRPDSLSQSRHDALEQFATARRIRSLAATDAEIPWSWRADRAWAVLGAHGVR